MDGWSESCTAHFPLLNFWASLQLFVEFLLREQVSQRRAAAPRRPYVSLPRTKQSFKPSAILSL